MLIGAFMARTSRKTIVLFAAGALAVIAAAFPGGPARADSVSLTLAAYSTPQAAYAEIIPAFQKTKAGSGVTFATSYGASGDQSRAVKNGLQADVVALALEPDINALVKAGLEIGRA